MNYNIDKFRVEDVMLPCNVMHQVMMLNDPHACINGLFYVADFSGTAGHFLQFTPSIIKRQVAYFEKALPLRIKAWCFINVSVVAEQFFKIILPLVSEKLRKRVRIKDIQIKIGSHKKLCFPDSHLHQGLTAQAAGIGTPEVYAPGI